MGARFCLGGCGRIIPKGSYCPKCRTPRTTGWDQTKIRRELVQAHVERHGLWCPGVPTRASHAVATISDLVVDHVKPLALGGKDIPSNRQVICRKCNFQKRMLQTG